MDKKLYRSTNDRVFLGLCGGLGEFFGGCKNSCVFRSVKPV
ncbi:PspC domain-containing protein [Enterocloster bolteae]|jgi:phage shock protein PspC (stress-responsive transcriptional regulator)